ncbi:hypothetical protein CJ030_MR1G027746 [Morella rubra]|uniref:Uncharacterized protein n=1 Tax=Morella rubra TaxID=262757 RepID=A0A6A1WPA0_9ROSI|nr:hypothetical protein CJ030_MR1G027746 [Morella rubra]
MTCLYNPNLIGRQSFQPKLQLNRHLGGTLLLNIDQVPTQPSEKAVSTPANPVRTDLALGQTKVTEPSPDQIHNKGQMKDFLGCMSSEPYNILHEMQSNKLLNTSDVDSFKQLLKGLMEKVWWHRDPLQSWQWKTMWCWSLGDLRYWVRLWVTSAARVGSSSVMECQVLCLSLRIS